MAISTFKIRVTGARGTEWYADKIGQEFEVVKQIGYNGISGTATTYHLVDKEQNSIIGFWFTPDNVEVLEELP